MLAPHFKWVAMLDDQNKNNAVFLENLPETIRLAR